MINHRSKGKQDVMDMGIAKYNAECRSIVMRYASEWRTTVERMARWIDFDNDYKTLNPTFMETEWWVFKQLFDKGLVYQGRMVSDRKECRVLHVLVHLDVLTKQRISRSCLTPLSV